MQRVLYGIVCHLLSALQVGIEICQVYLTIEVWIDTERSRSSLITPENLLVKL